MNERAAFVVTLLPAPDRNGIHDLRALLKIAKRRLNMRALAVREESIRRRSAGRRIVDHPKQQRRNEETQMTSLRKYGPQNRYLKLEDLHSRPPLRETIGLVKIENGKFGERIVLVLEPSGQMLSLNKTSVGALLRDFGAEDTDWIGKTVEIFAGTIETQTGTMDAVLVRGLTDVPADTALAAKAKAAAEKVRKAADMDDTIPF